MNNEIFFETLKGILYKGDSLQLIKSIKDNSIDFIFVDYPFNIQTPNYKKNEYVDFICKLSEEFYRVLKPNCVLLIINNPSNIWKTRNCYDKFTHRDSIALIRKGSLRPAWHFGFQHNYLMTFVKGNDLKFKWNGTKINHDKNFLTDVIYYQNSYRGKGKGNFHPQAIPLDLTQKMIEIFTNPEDTVLDPFLGSGTTAVACEILNRKWIGFEYQEKYCKMAKERIENTIKNNSK